MPWSSSQAGERQKQVPQQGAFRQLGQDRLHEWQWGVPGLCCQERLPGKVFLSEMKDGEDPVRAQGTRGAKAAGGRACWPAADTDEGQAGRPARGGLRASQGPSCALSSGKAGSDVIRSGFFLKIIPVGWWSGRL